VLNRLIFGYLSQKIVIKSIFIILLYILVYNNFKVYLYRIQNSNLLNFFIFSVSFFFIKNMYLYNIYIYILKLCVCVCVCVCVCDKKIQYDKNIIEIVKDVEF